jgi:hypothetical protein
MMAITTSSSTRVNAERVRMEISPVRRRAFSIDRLRTKLGRIPARREGTLDRLSRSER